MSENTGSETKVKKKRGWIVLLVILLVLASAGYMGYRQVMKLYDMAVEAKNNAEDAVTLLQYKQYIVSEYKLEKAHETLKYFRSLAENEKIYNLASKSKKYGEDFKSACLLMDIADETLDKWADRGYELLIQYPLDKSTIVTEDGFNIRAALAYLDFAEELVPEVERLLSEVSSIKLSFFDIKGTIDEHREKIDKYLGLYHMTEKYLPLLRAVLGDGSDRLFLIAAQNTAEIRPGGGFPGSIGTISIKDGILRINDFDSVWDVFPRETPYHLMPSASMNTLFAGVLGWPRDAEMCPDFEFVGKFWCDIYEYKYGVAPDMVVSFTPAIIQEVLKIFGEVTLSNGDVMNGDNAVRLLQYEWYARYLNAYALVTDGQANDRVDGLFNEVAKSVFSMVSDNFDVELFPQLIDLVEKSAKDRIFMMWLRDEEGQALVKSYGYSGGLSSDPEEPAIGVFFGNNYGSKFGWWIDCETWIGDGRKLSDGSMEYDVAVTFRNNFDPSQAYYLGKYIAGIRMNGVLDWIVYIVAPKDGYVYNMYIDYWNPCETTWYKGLQIGYKIKYYFNPGESVIRFQVRTAPGVTVKPTVYHTPTLTKYR